MKIPGKSLCMIFIFLALAACKDKDSVTHVREHICVPCNLACDTLAFAGPGTCPQCDMKLIPGRQEFGEDLELSLGSGNFLVRDPGDPAKTIRVFYYKPKAFDKESRILMVVPGSGRDGDEYRDSWIPASEEHNVLVLSPVFSAMDYGFEDYHLGGLIQNSNLADTASPVEGTNRVYLDESQLQYEINPDPGQWIFNAFVRIFDRAVEATGSSQKKFDLFGHSAGGHILHRMAMYYSNDKFNRIVASNASFYTLPTKDFRFPFGLEGGPDPGGIPGRAFRNNLVVFLGEADNADETGGTFLTSESADLQGSHRLERGRYFYVTAREIADSLDLPFRWNLVVVPGIGHDFRGMGAAAAEMLYPGHMETN